MRRQDCVAYRVLDELWCSRCGLKWDIQDSEPPSCKPRALTPRRPSIPYEALGPNCTRRTRSKRYLRK